MPDYVRAKYVSFGYNKWKQKPLRIGTPAGLIEISRSDGHSVRVDISCDGEKMADHVGRLVIVPPSKDRLGITLFLKHEERPLT